MQKTVFITGANQGIGLATVKMFRDKGWKVVAGVRRTDLDPVAFGDVMTVLVDMSQRAAVQSAVTSVLEQCGHIDVLVNNAGYAVFGPLESIPYQDIEGQFATNVLGPLALIKELIPQFKNQKSGAIVNISSVGGKVSGPFGSIYHGSKFAIEGISESLQWELAPMGVRVKLVQPGLVDTQFYQSALKHFERHGSDYIEARQRFETGYAEYQRRLISADTVAGAIYHAATESSNRLRVPVGDAAAEVLSARSSMDDQQFFGWIRDRFSAPPIGDQ